MKLVLWILIFISAFSFSQETDSIYTNNNKFQIYKLPYSESGDSINSNKDEFAPYYLDSLSILVFTSNRTLYNNKSTKQKLFFCKKLDSFWLKPIQIKINGNSDIDEGCFSPSRSDNLFYFSRRINKNSDIYKISYNISEFWIQQNSNLKSINELNTTFWESQPSITADGKTIYFASNRHGGFGKSDIWFSTMDENGIFSEAQNIGDSINTKGNEFSPFISKDGQELYFSSDGYSGYGKLDIFVSVKDSTGTWTKPKLLPSPINSSADELFFIKIDDKTNFFSSNRDGNFDIFIGKK